MAKQKDEVVIAALISTPTIKKASEVCGVSERNIYRHLQDAAFKAKYDKARAELLESYVNSLQQRIGGAIETMQKLIDDKENTPPQVQLNAAEAIIKYSLKLTEQIEIIKRIDALEEAVKEKRGE